MKQESLVSNYTIAQFKPHAAKCNEDKIENIVDCNFDEQPHLNVVISDLTYVSVGNHWHYLCVFVDLLNRESIGYISGLNKGAALVKKAFNTVNVNLNQIKIFHTNCENGSPAIYEVNVASSGRE